MNKLIKDMDEETWRKFTAYCKLKNSKISDELKGILNKHLKTELKELFNGGKNKWKS